ncbi:MAG: hypothetical protein O3A51_14650 [Verrucomicrobia bacterium]|nr:hypothetical protein [Verrucomicrobiota bacterium]
MHASILSAKRFAIGVPSQLVLIQKEFPEMRVDECGVGALM